MLAVTECMLRNDTGLSIIRVGYTACLLIALRPGVRRSSRIYLLLAIFEQTCTRGEQRSASLRSVSARSSYRIATGSRATALIPTYTVHIYMHPR